MNTEKTKMTSSQKRAKWLAARRRGIGGSDAAAVCGQSKWRTALAVYLDKIGEVLDEETPDQYRGKVLEPAVRQMYCDATGRVVETPDGIMTHTKFPFILASLDGIASERLVVDFKTARTKVGWGEPGTDEIPTEILFQVQHYMLVTGLHSADLAVLFGNFDFCIYTVEADAEFQELMLDAEREFWGRVERREPPEPVDASDVIRMWPASRAIAVTATPEVVREVMELRIVKEKIKTLEELEAALGTNVRAFIGSGDTLLLPDGKPLATWKSTKPREFFDAESFREDNPTLYDDYLRDGKPSRRLLLK